MKRVVKADSNLVSLDNLLEKLVLELENKAQEFCNEHGLSADTWGQVNDFDTNYDKTVDVDFSVTVNLRD